MASVSIDYSALTSTIIDAVPADVFLWIKFAMIAIVILFIIRIIKNIIQIGTASRIRKILEITKNINKKVDSFIGSSVTTGEEEQTEENDYQ